MHSTPTSLQVVVRNAYNAAEITEVSNQKITEYANRGFRALGIAKAPGDGSQDAGGKPRWEMIGGWVGGVTAAPAQSRAWA